MPIGRTFLQIMSKFLLHRKNHRREANWCNLFSERSEGIFCFFFFVFRRKRDNRQRILTKITLFLQDYWPDRWCCWIFFLTASQSFGYQNFRPPKIFFWRVISERNKNFGLFLAAGGIFSTIFPLFTAPWTSNGLTFNANRWICYAKFIADIFRQPKIFRRGVIGGKRTTIFDFLMEICIFWLIFSPFHCING